MSTQAGPSNVEDNAAATIQKAWKTHAQAPTDQEKYLNTPTRWNAAHEAAKMDELRKAAAEGRNTPRERWKRAGYFAARLQDPDAMLAGEGIDAEGPQKHLETQHWLELVDGKHRYGSNLKWYHRKWQDADTTENFFKWLDHGEGKDLSLDECSREQLEKERITYLSDEERLNYLVIIDSEGKLRWSKNKQLVDTSAGHYKDGGPKLGIVPIDHPNGPDAPRPSTLRQTSSISALSAGSEQENAAYHYVDDEKESKYKIVRLIRRHFTLGGIMNRLLRKTVRRNTWIYISDKKFNLMIGIKETGTFQHSSFLSGGMVTSAGLISVKKGVIHTLDPLSGHYRTSIDHFERFVDVLKERGVDMKRARISKAEAALWGIEHLGKASKAKRDAFKHVKDAAGKVGTAVRPNHHDKPDKTPKLKEKSAEKKPHEDPSNGATKDV